MGKAHAGKVNTLEVEVAIRFQELIWDPPGT
jgi:hypothetical protein